MVMKKTEDKVTNFINEKVLIGKINNEFVFTFQQRTCNLTIWVLSSQQFTTGLDAKVKSSFNYKCFLF